MSVRSDLAIGQLSVANNGNELLAILDLIANESVNEEEDFFIYTLNLSLFFITYSTSVSFSNQLNN